MKAPANGSGARPEPPRTAPNNITAAPPTKVHDSDQGSAPLADGALLHAVRLLPCARRRYADDIVLCCSACGYGHRFRGFGGRLAYSRRLPCRPWVTARVVVVAVLPAAGDVALVQRGAA